MKAATSLRSILFASAMLAIVQPAIAEDVAADEVDSAIIVTGSREANASINGLKVDPIRLPQNVRVLDEELIDRNGFTDLSQLYDLAGGMARQNSFGGAWDAYAIRGFTGDINQGPDLQINRFNSNRGFNARRDVATVESFQVLKGPASALSGKGEPGGSINIVTKAPRDEFHASADASYGSFDTYRGAVDFGGPVGNGFGARVVGVYQQSGGFRDFGDSDRLLFAPSISFAPSDSVRFLYQFEYNYVHFTHDRGIVAVNNDGKALPRRRFLGEPNDGDITQRTAQHQGTLTVDLADGIALEAGAQYRDGSFAGQSTHNSALVGNILRRQLRIHDYDWQDLSGRLELSANGSFLGLEHQVRVGADAFTYDQKRIFFRFSPTAAVPYGIDIFNPVYGQPKPVATLNQSILEELRGQSVYAQDLITLGDKFTLLLGVRHDWIQQTNTNFRTNVITTQGPSATSPRAAFTFAPSDQFSAYVSWGKSFRFNQGVDFASNAFAPEKGEAYEGGVKYALMDGKLNGTLSAFRITKDNILVNDPANSGFSIAAGRARSKGVEFDINWQASDQINFTAVYAYTDTKITRDTRPALLGSSLSNVPRHSATVYGFYQSNGSETGSISLGGGVTYVGGRPGDDINSGFRLPSYVTARLNAGYQISDKISVHIDAENLTNAFYLESSFSNVWITPGAPRSVKGRIKVEI